MKQQLGFQLVRRCGGLRLWGELRRNRTAADQSGSGGASSYICTFQFPNTTYYIFSHFLFHCFFFYTTPSHFIIEYYKIQMNNFSPYYECTIRESQSTNLHLNSLLPFPTATKETTAFVYIKSPFHRFAFSRLNQNLYTLFNSYNFIL